MLRQTSGDGSPKENAQVQRAVFANPDDMKTRMKETLTKKRYNVAEYYKHTGIAQAIATSPKFENLTLSIIAVNAMWISVDTDYNKADVLLDAHPVFQIAENLFCAYFTFEWIVRFVAFEHKRDCCRDGWFIFDSGLVGMMVLETWVMTVIMILAGVQGGGLGDASILRLVRLLRLSRMARMARLLRAMPELMIMIKGMLAAVRSVFFTITLLFLAMYVFSIAFTQLTAEMSVGDKLFPTVWKSMYTLLICGTLLDNIGVTMEDIAADSPVVAAIFLLFVLVGALTIMNMLIGVLCEVVSSVAQVEREDMAVGFVSNKMLDILETIDQDGDKEISKEEFQQILEQPEAIKALQEVDVDPIGLVDLADFIFQEEETYDAKGTREMPKKVFTFEEFMDVVYSLRGGNQATVKDMMTLHKFIQKTNKHTRVQVDRLRAQLLRRLDDIEELITGSPARGPKARAFGEVPAGKHNGHGFWGPPSGREEEILARTDVFSRWAERSVTQDDSDESETKDASAEDNALRHVAFSEPCAAMTGKTVAEWAPPPKLTQLGVEADGQHRMRSFESMLDASIIEVGEILALLKDQGDAQAPLASRVHLPGAPDAEEGDAKTGCRGALRGAANGRSCRNWRVANGLLGGGQLTGFDEPGYAPGGSNVAAAIVGGAANRMSCRDRRAANGLLGAGHLSGLDEPDHTTGGIDVSAAILERARCLQHTLKLGQLEFQEARWRRFPSRDTEPKSPALTVAGRSNHASHCPSAPPELLE